MFNGLKDFEDFNTYENLLTAREKYGQSLVDTGDEILAMVSEERVLLSALRLSTEAMKMAKSMIRDRDADLESMEMRFDALAGAFETAMQQLDKIYMPPTGIDGPVIKPWKKPGFKIFDGGKAPHGQHCGCGCKNHKDFSHALAEKDEVKGAGPEAPVPAGTGEQVRDEGDQI